MLNLEGQIGVLSQNGKQIAGLYDWESHVVLNFTTKDGMKEYKPAKHITARSYWILEPVRENVFDAEFYQIVSNELVLMDTGKVVIDFPDVRTTDQRLYAPINVRWIGVEY